MSKKVIVISNNSFSSIFNNGKTLEAIFNEFSKDDLSQIFFSELEGVDFNYCNKYYRVLDRDIIQSIKKHKKMCNGRLEESKGKPVTSSDRSSGRIRNFLYGRKSLEWLMRDILWMSNRWKNTNLIEWCKEQNADYIFFVGGPNGFAHKLTLYVQSLLDIPLVTFFTDDYLIYPRYRNIWDIIQRYRIKNFYKKTINKSLLCFCISKLMSEEYSAKFKRDFKVIMNSVPVIESTPINFKKDRLIMSYFGSIHTNRWKMLVRFGKLLQKNIIKEVELHVYCIHQPKNEILEEFKKCGIIYKGGVVGSELYKAIKKSDVLLHVESDDKFSKSITRLSVSTKIPEYLMAYRPIIGFGPNEVASMRLLEDNEVGLVIDSEEADSKILEILEVFLRDDSYKKKLAERGYKYALKHFDNKKMAYNFKLEVESILN